MLRTFFLGDEEEGVGETTRTSRNWRLGLASSSDLQSDSRSGIIRMQIILSRMIRFRINVKRSLAAGEILSANRYRAAPPPLESARIVKGKSECQSPSPR